MRKSDLENMVQNQKRQITWLERDVESLYNKLRAMAECLNIVYVPPETSKLKYEKKEKTGG